MQKHLYYGHCLFFFYTRCVTFDKIYSTSKNSKKKKNTHECEKIIEQKRTINADNCKKKHEFSTTN